MKDQGNLSGQDRKKDYELEGPELMQRLKELGIKPLPGSVADMANRETLRDRFAMAALTGFCANPTVMETIAKNHPDTKEGYRILVKCSFTMADIAVNEMGPR